MARGLFLAFPGHGHVNPTIGLVNELIRKGDEIIYICSEEFRSKFENTGAKFIGFDLDLSDFDGKNTIDNMGERFLKIFKNILNLAIEQEGEFDYIVVDPFIRPGTKIVEKFKVKKVITISTTFAINKEFSERILKSMSQDKSTIDKMTENFIKLKPEFEKLGKEFGISFPKKPIELITGVKNDLTIVFTSKYYQPNAEVFDETYKFVGPSIFDRRELEDFKIENSKNKKIVYISLGTIANTNIEFYKNCFKALGSREDLMVIMSVGKKINISDLGQIPTNFKLYNYVPQLEVLKKVDLFITHGGMNSSSEGLYNNVPLIVVPQFGDQPVVAKRVEELGAGVPLMGDISPLAIENAVNKILSDSSYKENAKKVGESLRECGGYKKAAEAIHKVI
ncbi:MAG: macrolide family glycosyltransferase [Sarcina ventriculi]|nr:macrolide family glycosyltransferase [Sarcina ventriculi]